MLRPRTVITMSRRRAHRTAYAPPAHVPAAVSTRSVLMFLPGAGSSCFSLELVARRLECEETRVEAVCVQQFGVAAQLGDHSVAEHGDEVGIADSSQPV